MSSYDYDLIVIGGGAAGFVASKLARGFGKKVALIENNRLGGACTNTGCIPSKALIRAAKAANECRRLQSFGLEPNVPLSLNTDRVMDHVRSVVDTVYRGHPPEKFAAQGIDVIFGTPRFLDSLRISVNNRTLSARRYLIATGSSSSAPAIEGLDTVPYLTNETLFQLTSLPRSLIVLGGGPSGIELASAFNRLGVEVTVVEALDRVLFREDRELVELLATRLTAEGLTMLTSARAVRFAPWGKGVRLTTEQGGAVRDISAENVLIAVGRKPNIEGLGLELAGVRHTDKGIVTNNRLQTTVPAIYACGDVVGPYQFSHMAEYQAVVACTNAFLPIRKTVDYRHVVWSTFTDPELARAGLTEDEARKRFGDAVRVYRYDYRSLDRAIAEGEDLGLAKYICDSRGQLVGVHILGSHATEVMHEAQLVKSLGIPFARIQKVLHAYPSYSDAVRQASKAHYIDQLRNNVLVRMITKLLQWRQALRS